MAPNSMSDAGPSTSCNSVKTTTITSTTTVVNGNGKGTKFKKFEGSRKFKCPVKLDFKIKLEKIKIY